MASVLQASTSYAIGNRILIRDRPAAISGVCAARVLPCPLRMRAEPPNIAAAASKRNVSCLAGNSLTPWAGKFGASGRCPPRGAIAMVP